MSTYDPAGPGHNPARRKALSCLAAWTGAGVIWTVAGGVPRALGATTTGTPTAPAKNALTFVQISDTHIGFRKEANPDVVGSLRRAIAEINALPQAPAFVVHTGDVSHLSRASTTPSMTASPAISSFLTTIATARPGTASTRAACIS